MQHSQQPSFLALLNPVLMTSCLWRHRDLLRQFTIRNLEMRHKGSMLGLLWSVLNPLMMLALYVFVFGFVFQGSFGVVENESKWSYGLGIFLGLALFHLVAESVSAAPSTITSHPNFVKKVVFPLEVLPAAAVGAAAVHMTVSLTMVAVGVLLGSGPLSPRMLLLPFLALPMIGFALGVTWFLSALGVFFRDIGQMVSALVAVLMFSSAVFYPASRVQENATAWSILQFNPLIHTIEMARDIMLWDRGISLTHLLVLYVAALLVAMFGFACFSRLRGAFADVL